MPFVQLDDSIADPPAARLPRRVSRTAAVLAGAAVVVVGSALPVLATPAPTLPASCADIATANPGSPDGDYRILLAGGRTVVYCSGMSTSSPAAYLTLQNTGGDTNFSSVTRPGEPVGIRTDWTRLHIIDRGAAANGDTCNADACIDTVDPAFSTLAPSSADPSGSVRYGFAEGDGGTVGHGAGDLTGTPFAFDPNGFALGGWMPSGNANFSASNQVVALDGSGGNGWMGPISSLVPLVRVDSPMMNPAAPTGLSATRGNGSATLSFTPGDDGGSSVTGWESSTDGGAWTPLATTAGTDGTLTGMVTGLTNGTASSIAVRAVNAIGDGSPSAATTVTPATTPGAPLSLFAYHGDGSALLTIAPANDTGGDPITGYEATTDGGTNWIPLTTSPSTVIGALSATLPDLTNGTPYTVAVRAVNSLGGGTPTAGFAVTPYTTPSAPTSLATTGPSAAVLNFTPGNDGGNAIDRWEMSTDGHGYQTIATTPGANGSIDSPLNVAADGNLHTLILRGVNEAGAGPGATITVTRFAPPPTFPPAAAPTNLTATPADGSATLTFTPSNGFFYEVNTGGQWSMLTTAPGPNGTLTAHVGGLTNGVTYTVRLRADGFGGPSSEVTTTVRPVAADPIVAKYDALGGPVSLLGSPVGPEQTLAHGKAQHYQRGWIYWSTATGAHEVHGHIADHYQELGAAEGPLGYPTTDETGAPDRVGRYNHFAGNGGSSIYWTETTGAHEVHGTIRAEWASLGWERGVAGYPTSDQLTAPDHVGRFNFFSGSAGVSIYWSPRSGAHEVQGAIRDRWAAQGWERGRLGYPVTSEYPVAGGQRSDFVGGSIVYNWASGRSTVIYPR